jgi:hypothetical protein
MIAPMPIQDIHAGREAFQSDLSKVLGRQLLADRGWAQSDDLTLLVPLFAQNLQGQMDWYLLRLVFDHYPKGPPSAQFVNPLTLSYAFPQDVMWVPKCEGATTIHFHPNYSGQQLICSSTTLEFYKVNHDVAQENIWNPERMNFISTIAAIRVGLSPNFYKGRSTQ